MKKRLFKKGGKEISFLMSALLVVIMLVSAFVPEMTRQEGSAKAAGHTQAEAVSWASAQIGKGLDYDGVYGNQCVDLIKYYYAYFGVADYARGNANAYITNALPAGWTRVYGNYQPGDIAVWKVNHHCNTCNTGGYGHVGIITSADSVGFNAVNQNFNNQSYCTQNWFWCSALACAIRPSFGPATHDPQGCLDLVSGGTGTVRVAGWAFDKDSMGTALDIHVYIGGPAGSGAEGYAIKANGKRPDVNNVYGCGDYHGFDATIATKATGTKKIYVYAINTGGGSNNPLIGSGNATIAARPAATPTPTATPKPTAAPTVKPVATATPKPTVAPKPTAAPVAAPKQVTQYTSWSFSKRQLWVNWGFLVDSNGYQVQYSTNKNFNSAKTINISSNIMSSRTITGLTSKKTYYTRVRAYKNSGNFKVYGSWSNVKACKVK